MPRRPGRPRPASPITSVRPARDHHARCRSVWRCRASRSSHDHTLVRGMDYYTRTTFEFQSSCPGGAVGSGGGGRYDDLVEAIGGPADPGGRFRHRGRAHPAGAVALGCGGPFGRSLRRSTWWPSSAGSPPRGRSPLPTRLRARGVAVDLDYMERSPKGQMKQAGRSGARYAFILGEQELAERHVTVRDLSGDGRSQRRGHALGARRSGRHRSKRSKGPAVRYRDEWCGECRQGACRSHRSRWPAGSSGGATMAGSSSSTCAIGPGCCSSSSRLRAIRRSTRVPRTCEANS